jgi:hypothetical protein
MLPKPQDAAGWSHQPRSSPCSTPSLLAEAKDHANRSSVAGVVDDLPADNVRDSFPTAVDEVELQGERAPALDPIDAPPHDLPRAHQRTDVVGIEGRSVITRIEGLFDKQAAHQPINGAGCPAAVGPVGQSSTRPAMAP